MSIGRKSVLMTMFIAARGKRGLPNPSLALRQVLELAPAIERVPREIKAEYASNLLEAVFMLLSANNVGPCDIESYLAEYECTFTIDPKACCTCGDPGQQTDDLLDGYPTQVCPRGHEKWLTTSCFEDLRHIIDSRVAKKCTRCYRWHCQTCNACDPDKMCHCDGTCS